MSKPLAFGLNLTKKHGATASSRGAPPSRAATFARDDDDSENDEGDGVARVEEIGGELDSFVPTTTLGDTGRAAKSTLGSLKAPPKLKSKGQASAMFGDLSNSLQSRKNADAATEADSSIYEYDAVYDSLKPKKAEREEDAERKPKYMRSLIQAAETRKRDALIATEKKIAREREAEGDEFADKEKFVTEAYKKQQEENRKVEEEEKQREEAEAKKNKGGGMSAFYRKMLDKDEARHSELVKAAEQKLEKGTIAEGEETEEASPERKEADLARELNEKGASVAINEDGQVVDKRELLRGGLNVGTKKKEETKRESTHKREPERRNANGVPFARKQAMRERQTRMIEEQLEQTLKRSREAEENQRQEVEHASKSRKTESDISSAKERYLARKRAAEEAKKKGENL
ncbi:coiled-coil domain-containing protein 55 [Moelleriella libera RCEF 2490]|uniref:Coiled-coil domain-containing protein 55 n=1 Tax=Moelleriella libera RCEF 2490 TaxID=1081109 RepID=A0A166USM3_9HYPO|nr:coiled-coil domain-containing protein 55 [Moelleriella libera RCEF 2490]